MTHSLPPIDAAALLRGMVAIPSVSTQEAALAAHLCAVGRAYDLGVEVTEVGNFVARTGQDGPMLVLLGHMDTVGGEIPVREEDGKLYGRGAVDAKGPLACFLAAAINWHRSHGEGLTVTVIGAVEEELGSRGARALVGMDSPRWVVIGEPSGWQNLTLGYKGKVVLSYRLSQPMAHRAGSYPPAAERAIDGWLALREACEELNHALPPQAGPFDRLTARLVAMHSESDGLHDAASLVVDMRLPPRVAPEEVLGLAAAQSGEGSWVPMVVVPPYRAPHRTPLVAALSAAIRAEGGTPSYTLKSGTSDMNVVAPAWQCPIVAYGPGDPLLNHSPQEHVSLDEVHRSATILTRMLSQLATR